MQRAARVIVEKHGGKFPSLFEDVLELPGVGRYTAGAICSIAFNQPVPVLDGNVTRVLTRVLGIAGNTRESSTRDHLWRIAEQLVQRASRMSGQRDRASRLNQALMELGALICKPSSPDCGACPVARSCSAFLHNRIAELPNLNPRPRTTRRCFVAFVIERQGRFLVRKRPPGEVNAHLWEFPNAEVSAVNVNGDLKHAAQVALGGPVEILEPLCTIKHSITRYRITLEAFRAPLPLVQAGRLSYNGVWLPYARLKKLAFSSAHKKILQEARRSGL
jgi:A/G-specific adenine glycosylase